MYYGKAVKLASLASTIGVETRPARRKYIPGPKWLAGPQAAQSGKIKEPSYACRHGNHGSCAKMTCGCACHRKEREWIGRRA